MDELHHAVEVHERLAQRDDGGRATEDHHADQREVLDEHRAAEKQADSQRRSAHGAGDRASQAVVAALAVVWLALARQSISIVWVTVPAAAFAGLLIALKAGGAGIGWGFQLQSPVVVAPPSGPMSPSHRSPPVIGVCPT